MDTVKYFKFELDTPSREALKLINENLKKGVEWGKNKYYYGHSKYYYGSDGTCEKDVSKILIDQIISAKEMIELLTPKKEAEPEILDLKMEINYKGGLKVKLNYDNKMIIDILKSKSVESVIIKPVDPLFIEFKKIFEKDNTLTEVFNEVKKLFNK